MEIKYSYTILYVKDLPATVDFYKLAFGFKLKFQSPENDYAELETGPTVLAFADLALGKSNFRNGFKESSLAEVPFGIELAFTTSEVEKVMNNAIKHGAELLEKTVSKPWGQQVAYLRDINGFIIEICTPIS